MMTLRKAGSGIEFVLFPMVHVADIERGWRALPWQTRTVMGALMPLFAIDGMLGGRGRLLDPSIEVNDLPTAEEELTADEFDPFEDAIVGDRDNRVVAALTEIDRTRAGERVREADWVTVIAG